MAYYHLKENHPFAKKVRKLEDLANELGIRIKVTYNDQIILTDIENSIDYQYRDIEQNHNSIDSTSSFPYFAETKIIFDKDE